MPFGFPIGLNIDLKEDVVINLNPDFGYLRTGVEKIIEGIEIDKVIPFINRVDTSSAISVELAYCIALENYFKIEVPIRAKFIRVILSELSRISSHILFLTKLANALGMNMPLHYCLREREEILHLIEVATGSRLTPNFVRVGGIKSDLSMQFFDKLKEMLKGFRKKVHEIRVFFLENELVVNRLNNLGILVKEDAIKLAISGPNLRALGVSRDIRKNDNYEIYDEFNFKVPIGDRGDSLDRCMVRIEEIEQSISIISQALYKVPEGKIRTYGVVNTHLTENIYSHVECPHGELGMNISVSEGRIAKLSIKGPSYNNLFAFSKAVIGEKLEDIELILASFDICVCEVDK